MKSTQAQALFWRVYTWNWIKFVSIWKLTNKNNTVGGLFSACIGHISRSHRPLITPRPLVRFAVWLRSCINAYSGGFHVAVWRHTRLNLVIKLSLNSMNLHNHDRAVFAQNAIKRVIITIKVTVSVTSKIAASSLSQNIKTAIMDETKRNTKAKSSLYTAYKTCYKAIHAKETFNYRGASLNTARTAATFGECQFQIVLKYLFVVREIIEWKI